MNYDERIVPAIVCGIAIIGIALVGVVALIASM